MEVVMVHLVEMEMLQLQTLAVVAVEKEAVVLTQEVMADQE
jgi:hypothetical protein